MGCGSHPKNKESLPGKRVDLGEQPGVQGRACRRREKSNLDTEKLACKSDMRLTSRWGGEKGRRT